MPKELLIDASIGRQGEVVPIDGAIHKDELNLIPQGRTTDDTWWGIRDSEKQETLESDKGTQETISVGSDLQGTDVVDHSHKGEADDTYGGSSDVIPIASQVPSGTEDGGESVQDVGRGHMTASRPQHSFWIIAQQLKKE